MVLPPWMAVAMWTAAAAAGVGLHPQATGGQTPSAVVASDERAQTLLALTPGDARTTALQTLSPHQLVEVSAALAAMAERWRLAGQNGDALGAARLAVECAERAQDEPTLARLHASGWFVYRFLDGTVRFMCSWATTAEAVDELGACLRSLA